MNIDKLKEDLSKVLDSNDLDFVRETYDKLNDFCDEHISCLWCELEGVCNLGRLKAIITKINRRL